MNPRLVQVDLGTVYCRSSESVVLLLQLKEMIEENDLDLWTIKEPIVREAKDVPLQVQEWFDEGEDDFEEEDYDEDEEEDRG